jgi:hypothetical protein
MICSNWILDLALVRILACLITLGNWLEYIVSLAARAGIFWCETADTAYFPVQSTSCCWGCGGPRTGWSARGWRAACERDRSSRPVPSLLRAYGHGEDTVLLRCSSEGVPKVFRRCSEGVPKGISRGEGAFTRPSGHVCARASACRPRFYSPASLKSNGAGSAGGACTRLTQSRRSARTEAPSAGC